MTLRLKARMLLTGMRTQAISDGLGIQYTLFRSAECKFSGKSDAESEERSGLL